jgi:hypothetical protein
VVPVAVPGAGPGAGGRRSGIAAGGSPSGVASSPPPTVAVLRGAVPGGPATIGSPGHRPAKADRN